MLKQKEAESPCRKGENHSLPLADGNALRRPVDTKLNHESHAIYFKPGDKPLAILF